MYFSWNHYFDVLRFLHLTWRVPSSFVFLTLCCQTGHNSFPFSLPLEVNGTFEWLFELPGSPISGSHVPISLSRYPLFTYNYAMRVHLSSCNCSNTALQKNIYSNMQLLLFMKSRIINSIYSCRKSFTNHDRHYQHTATSLLVTEVQLNYLVICQRLFCD